jgi:hypothetical protein
MSNEAFAPHYWLGEVLFYDGKNWADLNCFPAISGQPNLFSIMRDSVVSGSCAIRQID